MNQYIAAVDQGTTSSRCIVFDHDGRIVSVAGGRIAVDAAVLAELPVEVMA